MNGMGLFHLCTKPQKAIFTTDQLTGNRLEWWLPKTFWTICHTSTKTVLIWHISFFFLFFFFVWGRGGWGNLKHVFANWCPTYLPPLGVTHHLGLLYTYFSQWILVKFFKQEISVADPFTSLSISSLWKDSGGEGNNRQFCGDEHVQRWGERVTGGAGDQATAGPLRPPSLCLRGGQRCGGKPADPSARVAKLDGQWW